LVLDTAGVSLVGAALPSIAAAFGASMDEVQWIVSGHLAGGTLALLPGGWLAGRIGARRALVLSVVVTAAAYAGGALAPSLGLVVLSRVIAGVAAGAGVPAGLALVCHLAPGAARARAMATYIGCGAAAVTAGWALGGVLTEIGWRVTVAGPALLAVVIAVGARVLLPHVPASRVGAGAVRVVGGLLASWQTRYAVIGAAAVFASVVTYQTMLILYLAAGGWSPGQIAGLFGVLGLTGAAGTPGAGRLIDCVGSDRVLLGGALVSLVGYLLTGLIVSTTDPPPFLLLALCLVLVAAGVAAVLPVLMTLGTSTAGAVSATAGALIITAQHAASVVVLPLVSWGVGLVGAVGRDGPELALWCVSGLAGAGVVAAIGAVVRRPALAA